MGDIINRITRAVSEQEEIKKPAPEEDMLKKAKPTRIVEPSEQTLFSEELKEFGLEESQAMLSASISWEDILTCQPLTRKLTD